MESNNYASEAAFKFYIEKIFNSQLNNWPTVFLWNCSKTYRYHSLPFSFPTKSLQIINEENQSISLTNYFC